MKNIARTAALAGILWGGAASAQMPGMHHGPAPAANAGTTPPGSTPAANQAEMMRKMEDMNKAMMGAPMSGDPDRDLVAMMIPHHQGAIDMARIYLRDGKDPVIRRMAQKIVTDQQREIAQFRSWLARHPAPGR